MVGPGVGVEVGVGVAVGVGVGEGATKLKFQVELQSLHVPDESLAFTLQYQVPSDKPDGV